MRNQCVRFAIDPRRGVRWFVMALLVFSVIVTSNAQAVADDEVKEKLDGQVSLKLEATTLQGVVELFKKQFNVELIIDENSIEELDVTLDSKIGPFEVSDIRLRMALRFLLEQLDPSLRFRTIENGLEITTNEVVDLNLEYRLFVVDDLLRSLPEDMRGQWIAFPSKGTGFYEHSPFTDGFPNEQDPLLELITTIIEPTTCDEVGGPGRVSVLNKTLIVINREEVLDRVGHLLDTLRAVSAAQKKEPLDVRPVELGVSPAEVKYREKLLAILDRKITMDYDGTPLAEVAKDLQKQLGMSVRLDLPALEELAIGPDTPVTMSQGKRSARVAIPLMFRTIDYSMRTYFRDDVLLITTKEKCECDLTTRLYPILDLLKTSPSEKASPDTQALSSDSVEDLIEIITTTVDPQSWDEVGGPGRLHFDPVTETLVVSAGEQNHHQLQQFLAKLRQTIAERLESGVPVAKVSKPCFTVVYRLWQAKEDPVLVKEENLIALLKLEIEPTSWQADEVSTRFLPGRLIIRQRAAVHEQIKKALDDLELFKPKYKPKDDED